MRSVQTTVALRPILTRRDGELHAFLSSGLFLPLSDGLSSPVTRGTFFPPASVPHLFVFARSLPQKLSSRSVLHLCKRRKSSLILGPFYSRLFLFVFSLQPKFLRIGDNHYPHIFGSQSLYTFIFVKLLNISSMQENAVNGTMYACGPATSFVTH